MFEKKIDKAADLIRAKGYTLLNGLSNQEIQDAENFYNISFPPDLKELYMAFYPYQFCDWRDFSKTNAAKVRRRLDWPVHGLLFDVKHSAFWMESWGERPENMDTAVEIARERLKIVPSLIPIYSHRYLPGSPNEAGNPVLSVYQRDIIYYGEDLFKYFDHEFGSRTEVRYDKIKKTVPFWGQFAEENLIDLQ
ncbi:MAG: SMI1/KNR4 family protein [Peptococcaceae bacterium]|nr:SMI1/KNR4 family protein [Peptococcaceae bacterium]